MRKKYIILSFFTLSVLGILFFYACIIGGFIPYFLLYFSFFIFLYEWITLRKGFGQVQISRQIDCQTLPAGEDVEVTLQIHRSGWWPLCWIYIQEELPGRLALHTKHSRRVFFPFWRQDSSYSYFLQNIPRGVYTLYEVTLTSGDIFGLLSFKRSFQIRQTLTVYPKLVYMANGWPEEAINLDYGQMTRKIAWDSQSLFGIRDYQPGDRLSKIHWKATARRGLLQTKQYEPYATNEPVLILDAAHASYISRSAMTFELALVMTASLLRQMNVLRQNVATIFTAEPMQSMVVETNSLLYFDALKRLAGMEANGQTNFLKIAHECAQSQPAGTLFIVVSPRVDEEMERALLHLCRFGSVDWFVPLPGGATPTELAFLQHMPSKQVRTHVITSVDQLAKRQRGGVLDGHAR